MGSCMVKTWVWEADKNNTAQNPDLVLTTQLNLPEPKAGIVLEADEVHNFSLSSLSVSLPS